MTIEIIVCEIEIDKYQIKKYVISFIYFQKKDNQSFFIKTCFRKKIHLIENLKINILIDTNIFTPKNFILNFNKDEIFINNYLVIISIISKRHVKSIINYIISLKNSMIISLHFQFRIKIYHFVFFEKKNFLFEFENVNFGLYAHVIKKNRSIKMFQNFRLERIIEIKYFNAY